MTDVARLVADGYDQAAEAYALLESPDAPWPRNRRLAAFLLSVPTGGFVLDVGCGSGVPADRIIAAEHRVLGIDVSARHVELARRAVPAGEFRCGDVSQMAFDPKSFDAIVSFYAIDHIPRSAHPELFRRFHSWLRVGGRLLIAVESCDQPDKTGEWLGVPMFLSHYDAETTTMLIRQAGFDVVSADVESQIEAGRDIPYLWLSAVRLSDDHA